MYYKKENGKIVRSSAVEFEGCSYTEEMILEGFDHSFYLESDMKTEEYLARKKEYERKQEIKKSIKQLEDWFENYFDKQLKQSLWQEDFKPSYDKHFNCEYLSLDELKTKAQEIRQKIKTLRLEA